MMGFLQVWICQVCQHERKYGQAPAPEHTDRTALLFCSACKRVTAHKFDCCRSDDDAKTRGVELLTKVGQLA